MVTLSLRGYLNETFCTLMSALPLDLTPSIGPGTGKWNLSFVALNSKYAFASGRMRMSSVRLPLYSWTLRLSISSMCVHTSVSRPLSCETMMDVTSVRLIR